MHRHCSFGQHFIVWLGICCFVILPGVWGHCDQPLLFAIIVRVDSASLYDYDEAYVALQSCPGCGTETRGLIRCVVLCLAALCRHVRGPHRRLCQAVLALLPLPGLRCGRHLHHPLHVHLHSLHDLLHPLHVLPQVRNSLRFDACTAVIMTASILYMYFFR